MPHSIQIGKIPTAFHSYLPTSEVYLARAIPFVPWLSNPVFLFRPMSATTFETSRPPNLPQQVKHHRTIRLRAKLSTNPPLSLSRSANFVANRILPGKFSSKNAPIISFSPSPPFPTKRADETVIRKVWKLWFRLWRTWFFGTKHSVAKCNRNALHVLNGRCSTCFCFFWEEGSKGRGSLLSILSVVDGTPTLRLVYRDIGFMVWGIKWFDIYWLRALKGGGLANPIV